MDQRSGRLCQWRVPLKSVSSGAAEIRLPPMGRHRGRSPDRHAPVLTCPPGWQDVSGFGQNCPDLFKFVRAVSGLGTRLTGAGMSLPLSDVRRTARRQGDRGQIFCWGRIRNPRRRRGNNHLESDLCAAHTGPLSGGHGVGCNLTMLARPRSSPRKGSASPSAIAKIPMAGRGRQNFPAIAALPRPPPWPAD